MAREKNPKSIRLGSSFTLGEAEAACRLHDAIMACAPAAKIIALAKDPLLLRVQRRMAAMRDRGRAIAAGEVKPRVRPLKRLEPSYAGSEPAVISDAE